MVEFLVSGVPAVLVFAALSAVFGIADANTWLGAAILAVLVGVVFGIRRS